MGIVSSQSFKNTIITYIGFGIGAINTLFLFTSFLTPEYYGLVAFILSTANIMMPIMAFGVQNALVKFYNGLKGEKSQNSFLTLMLLLPLIVIIPLGFTGILAYDFIADLLSRKNEIVRDYIWYIFFTAITMAYFEIFFAWSKVHMLTVFGNFLKEVFHRAFILLLLLVVSFNLLSMDGFIISLVLVYTVRMILMMLYAFSLRLPVLRFKRIENRAAVLNYAFLIIIAGSIATVILDIDKFMIAQYMPIANVAFYSVAIYTATIVAVPQRAMHQILLPLTAKYLSDKDIISLKNLYLKSSLTLFIIGGFIFLIVVLNVNELYKIVPEEYSGGVSIVLMISAAKLYDNLLGNNNAILFNSDYYKMVLVFGVLLTLLAIVLNIIFIPIYGIKGSAIATLLAIFIYNSVKILYVKRKFNMHPITSRTLKVGLLIIFFYIGFYFWDFTFNPYVNIVLKSIIISILYIGFAFKLNLSEDINEALKNVFNKVKLYF